MDPLTMIAAISAATALIEQGWKFMEERRRKKELTPEEEQAWDAYVLEQTRKIHWKPSA